MAKQQGWAIISMKNDWKRNSNSSKGG